MAVRNPARAMAVVNDHRKEEVGVIASELVAVVSRYFKNKQ